ncbi:MAG: hypothetical protein OIF57_06585 [Marinobacterium sp.]|nr:hypothetical protein [Marinobacterium sp.]
MSNSITLFKSVSDMVSDSSLQVGQIVQTLGYHAGSAEGGNVYEIVAAGSGIADGGSFINMSSTSLQAKGLFMNKQVNVAHFGAKPGMDSTEAFRKAMNFSKAVQVAPAETAYIISGEVETSTCRQLLSDGAKIKFTSTTAMRGLVFKKSTGLRIRGFHFETAGTVDQFISAIIGSDIEVSDNTFDHAGCSQGLNGHKGGLYLGSVSNVRILRNTFKNGWRDTQYHAGNINDQNNGGNNLLNALYISSTADESGFYIKNNSFYNVWSAVYAANCNDLNIIENTVTKTADTGFFDRCTGAITYRKRILNNRLVDIGKSAIKALDTNNDSGAGGEDALVEGNSIENWGMNIPAACILSANNYTSTGYMRGDKVSKGLKVINNTMVQTKPCLTCRPFNITNIEDVVIANNTIKPINKEGESNQLTAHCKNVTVQSNLFAYTGNLRLAYKHEGDYSFTDNKVTTYGPIQFYRKTDGIDQRLVFSNNQVENLEEMAAGTGGTYGLANLHITEGFSLVCTGNQFKVNAAKDDGFGGGNKNMVVVLDSNSHIIDNNQVEFTDAICTQKMMAGDLLYPLHYRGLAGAARIDNGSVIYKASNERTGDLFIVSKS